MGDWFPYVSYVFGGLLVSLYSFNAFNDPEYHFVDEKSIDNNYWIKAKPGLPKYMTNKFRYHVFNAIFILFSITLYVLLAELLPILPGADKLLSDDSSNKALVEGGMAIFSALLLLGLVHFVEWPKLLLFGLIKGWLHDFANIPTMGRNIFESLCYEQLDLELDVTQNKIKSLLKNSYVDNNNPRKDLFEDDFKVGNSNNIIWKWARLSYGIHIVEEWSKEPLYEVQLKESTLGWLPLRQDYKEHIDKMVEQRKGSLNENEQTELNDEIEKMLANCYRLLTCLIIMVGKSTEDPYSHIKKIGYQIIPGNRFVVKGGEIFRVLLAMVPSIILIAFIYALALGEAKTGWGLIVSEIIIYVESAIIILIVPVVIVTGVKRHLSMNRTWRVVTRDNPYESFFEMPLGIYSFLSCISWFISTTLMVVLLNSGKPIESIEVWKHMGVYCFISAITAFFVAYRVDIPPIIYPSRLFLIIGRSKGALLQGALTAIIVWSGMVMYPHPDINAVWKFPLMGFVVAFVINYALFYGKHSFERRGELREYVNEQVTVIFGDISIQAKLISKSDTGACVKVNSNRILPKGSKIELINNDDLKLIGQIVSSGINKMHIQYL